MKIKLLLLLLIVFTLSIDAQILPAGHYGMFEFTNGNLSNGSTNGGPDLTGTPSLTTDRNANSGNALGPSSGALTGHTLGAANYNDTTLSFWMKNTTIQSNFSQRVIQMYGAGGNGYKLEIGANSFVINAKNTQTGGSPGQYGRTLAVNLSDGVWHHIVVRTQDVSFNSSVIIEVFVDNVLQNSMGGSIGPFTSGASNTFIRSGHLIINPTNTYLGSIDDIYLYKSALTNAEISNIYNYTPAIPSGIQYVNANASGSNNSGTSWANAHLDLQSALASANSNDEIWIAQGIYSPAISDRSTYFDISSANLKIYGGFVGTETSIDDRIIGAYPTTLSGDLDNNDVNETNFIDNYLNTTRNADNSYYVVNITSQGENLLLDGLTISGAHTNIDAATHGGAIMKHASVANLTLRNCIIKDNVSRNFCAGLNTDFDLANRNGNRGSLVIDRCQFTNNMSRIGSGVYFRVGPSTNVDLTVTNSVFDHNLAGDLNTTNAKGFAGSAMWIRTAGSDSDANYAIYNNTFVNNRDMGDTSYDDRFRAPVIMANHGNFSNNIANAIVANCIFWNNTGLGDHTSTGGLTRAISDMHGTPITSLNVFNSLDPLNFVEGSITSSANTITTDPLFTDIANGDYSLTTSSPAIDMGNNNYDSLLADFRGNPRIYNTTVDVGAIEFGSGPLGINDNISLQNIKIYPNPVNNILNIQIDESLESVEVYSIQGQKVMSTNSLRINVSNLSAGIYLLKAYTSDKEIFIKRFIKK